MADDERNVKTPPTPLDDKTVKEKFGKRLSELRKAKGMSRKELAAVLDVSTISVASYEQGLRQPAFSMLIRLAEYFGVTLDELLGLDDITRAQIINDYRRDKAIELLGTVGKISSSQNVYVLGVPRKLGEKFITDDEGNIKRNASGDAMIFGGTADLVDFAESLAKTAMFTDKTFKTAFDEISEKLYIDTDNQRKVFIDDIL